MGDLSDLAQEAVARLCAQMRAKAAAGPARSVLGDPCVAAMAYALCDDDDGAAAGLVHDLLAAGLSVQELCLDHLAPAARRLGDMWDRDRLPFTEVAVASARIQAILRRLPAGRTALRGGSSKGAIFAAVPGEQHTLGVMMAADLFRREGWDVGLLVGLTHDQLVARISRDDRPVIGLSCSSTQSYAALRRLVAALARTRPDADLLLSGQIVQDAARIKDLPGPVTIVTDLDAAKLQMARIAAERSKPASTGRSGQGRQRASSAA
jgi:methanogenic corrinoid protein MtbC1